MMSVFTALPAAHAAGSAFRVHDLESPANGRAYRLLIAAPRTPPPAAGWPALFLLDGNHTAPIALEWLRRHDLADRVLLVGIGYPDTEDFNVPRRYEDMTPIAVADHPGSGGSDAFLSLIGRRIRPFVAARHPLDPHRQALFGHSLGGLAVLAQIVRDPAAFSAYFAASPSLWWADGAFRQRLRRFVDATGCDGAGTPRVIVTVGRDEQPPPGAARRRLSESRRARLAERRMVDHALWAARTLEDFPGWRVSRRVLPDAGHGESIAGGLHHALDQWLTPGG